MTKNLFHLTYELATELGILSEAFATGGSDSTIIDTVFRTEADDYWNGGAAWIIYDAGGAGAGPQGFYGNITDFVNSTNTITFSQIVPSGQGITSVAVGDRYAVAHKVFPIHDLIMNVNRAIRDVGPIPVTNSTAIDTVAAQTEYTLPIEASPDLKEVYIQTKLSDADDNKWVQAYNWEVQPTATGTADTLVFDQQPIYPRDVLLKYLSPHAKLVDYDDNLSESIRWERVIYKAALHTLNHWRIKTQSDDKWMLETIRDYERRSAEAELKYPIKIPQKTGKIMIVGPAYEDEKLAPGENTI